MMTYNRYDGFRFVWNGSRTVNIYTPNGANVDVFSLDYSREWDQFDWLEIMDLCDEWEVSLV